MHSCHPCPYILLMLINWANNNFDRVKKTNRVEMTKHQMHQSNSMIEKIVPPRHRGGRGAVDVKNLYKWQVIQFRNYFNGKWDVALHSAICKADLDYLPLILLWEEALKIGEETTEESDTQWRQKSVHTEHPETIDQHEVNSDASDIWLKRGAWNVRYR